MSKGNLSMSSSLAFARSRIRVFGLFFLLLVQPAMATEDTLPRPVSLTPLDATQEVLRVAGEQGDKSYSLSRIEALGLYRVNTTTFWPEDDGTYEGVLLADLLADAGLSEASAIRILALDGFSQVMPREDWERWPVLLATRRDGRPMGVRDKGPLRIIYPRDADPRLSDSVYRLRWVWLIDTIEQVEP